MSLTSVALVIIFVIYTTFYTTVCTTTFDIAGRHKNFYQDVVGVFLTL